MHHNAAQLFNFFFKYFKIKSVILNCNNILQLLLFLLYFDQINAALVNIRDFFKKH